MTIKVNEDAFSKLVTHEKSDLINKLRWEEENEEWLNRSAMIAFTVLRELDNRGWSKTDLAYKLKVSNSYISKLVKGQENLTLDTLCKLERVLGINLLTQETLAERTEDNYYTIYQTYSASKVAFNMHLFNPRIKTRHSSKYIKVISGKTSSEFEVEACGEGLESLTA